MFFYSVRYKVSEWTSKYSKKCLSWMLCKCLAGNCVEMLEQVPDNPKHCTTVEELQKEGILFLKKTEEVYCHL